MKKLISIAVSLIVIFSTLPLSAIVKADTTDWGSDYDSATEFTISDKEELIAFRDMVNSGKSFSKKTVSLTADIDLNNEEWIPIGSKEHPFAGSFQGNQKTVRNLKITDETLNEAGFFGNAQGAPIAVIADLTLENVDIRANHTVGALGGYMVTKTMNCNVIGDITITGTFMVGGLAGDHYSTITNSHVRGNEGSSVNGLYVTADSEGDNIGGLVGLRGEDGNLISDCSVANLKITGTRKIGGLIGAAFLSSSIENCNVNNVVIETNASIGYALLTKSSMGLGGLVGVFNSYSDTGHISSSTVSDIEFIIPENIIKNVTAGYMYGLSRATGGITPDLSDNLVTGSFKGSNNAKDSVAGIAVHYKRIEPTCLEAGRMEHWLSNLKYYADLLLNKEITEADTIIPASGHHAVHIEAKNASCIETGNIDHWHCETCDEYFADEALTTMLDKNDVVLAKTSHTISEIKAKEPTCSEAGNIAHWHCEICDEYFADEALTIKINKNDVLLKKTGHTISEIKAKEPTCNEAGHIAYWHCEACDEYFADEALTIKINKNDVLVEKTGHTISEIKAKEPTCNEAGNIAYWHCETCDEYFADEALTIKINKNDVLLKKTGHTISEIKAKEPTCNEAGHIAYWYCESCGKYYSDEALTIEITLEETIVKASGHTELKLINAKEASCTEAGYTGDYLCVHCNEIIRKGTVTAKTAHEYVNGECIKCHEKDPNYINPEDTVPPMKNDADKNNDNTPIETDQHEENNSVMTGVEEPYTLYLLISVCSGFGLLAWWRMKREKV